jgi:hypothetical protein
MSGGVCHFPEFDLVGQMREMQMSDNPTDVIEAAIRSAFTSYPKEDDSDWRSPDWVKPQECVHLAQGIVLELQANGFEIVKADLINGRLRANRSNPLI